MEKEKVKIWEQEVVIPTYETGEADKNPMFLEKRVYQGSSGKVYPHSVIDKICDEKTDKVYQAVFLENEYLQIMVLPELGGRIQRALDKTNNYDFVYYNHVIKPALVGLAGPWISGGIEFNWPQHHRPSTFEQVDYTLVQNEDGSATVWVGEIENMFRTKGMSGFTLHPDKAYVEIQTKIYNRTDLPQTFLWWANPAIPANEDTQSIFPPDVHAVMDHGKRAVSDFPIATGTYYKMDYSAGVDISRYKNIPVPTSYMAYHSEYDFVGSYDYGRQAGILHVADHHISPGKKQWTWGCGEFGKAWDRNLTDEDGPYIELMTGCFTDNQPDFTWIMPYEEKTFTQYFMPYKGVGVIQNATAAASVGLDVEGEKAVVKVYVTSAYQNARLVVTSKSKTEGKREYYLDERLNLSPEHAYRREFGGESDSKVSDYTVTLFDSDGKKLVSSALEEQGLQNTPEPAAEAPLPGDVKTIEELFLYGTHLEQYRHATYDAEDYYKEGLRRDENDIRINNAYGKLLLRKGRFAEAEKHFTKAIHKMMRSNPNPYDGEPLYNAGLALKYQGKYEEAYDRFYKAAWNGAWQDSAFYQLACLDCIKGDMNTALSHIDNALIRNWHHMKARNLKTAILRKTGRGEAAKELIRESGAIDCLDFNRHNELAFLLEESGGKREAEEVRAKLRLLMHRNHNTYIELAIDYMEAGMYTESAYILRQYTKEMQENKAYPMVYYYLVYIAAALGEKEKAAAYFANADKTCSDYCFPHRLEDILVLEKAKEVTPELPKAYYYLGNLWYDKKQYEKAVTNWESARSLDESFNIVHRNLALAYYNKQGLAEQAVVELERAYELCPKDGRILMELDQLYKKMGKSFQERQVFLEKHLTVVRSRDDLYLEYITLLNAAGRFREAKELIEQRKFHPWEGGEGKVPAQYILSHVELAKEAMNVGDYKHAEELLRKAAGEYPHNLGEGKLAGAQENNIYYYLGMAYMGMQEKEKACTCFEKAAVGLSEPSGMMYYNDQPPEMIFYQGTALMKLGRKKEAYSRFNKLIAYGKKHIFNEVSIEYFAVSLPDLQIFEEDLNRKNQAHCYFMMALGHLGKGEAKEAEKYLEMVNSLDSAHLGARLHKGFVL